MYHFLFKRVARLLGTPLTICTQRIANAQLLQSISVSDTTNFYHSNTDREQEEKQKKQKNKYVKLKRYEFKQEYLHDQQTFDHSTY